MRFNKSAYCKAGHCDSLSFKSGNEAGCEETQYRGFTCAIINKNIKHDIAPCSAFHDIAAIFMPNCKFADVLIHLETMRKVSSNRVYPKIEKSIRPGGSCGNDLAEYKKIELTNDNMIFRK